MPCKNKNLLHKYVVGTVTCLLVVGAIPMDPPGSGLSGLGLPGRVCGQDQPKETDDTPPAPPKGDPQNPLRDAGPAAAAFQLKLDEWKQFLKSLRDLQKKYKLAEEDEGNALKAEWDALAAKGDSLIDELQTTGKAAFVAAPNEDRSLTRFLVKVVGDRLQRDQYEAALDLVQALVESDCGISEVYNQAGIASFVLDRYDDAEKYLTEARARNALKGDGQKFFDALADYKEYWEQEQDLRKKEAEADDLPRVKLETSKGTIVIELFENEAPDTVGNFISLVESGFYEGLKFHRVEPQFMAQGGCPEGTGSGGPGYKIRCECYGKNHRNHFRGSLSMAHAGRDTGGSQFYLTFVPTPHLNGKHTVFGRVIEGLEVLEKIQRKPGMGSLPPAADTIIKATVLRKRDHEYVPNKTS